MNPPHDHRHNIGKIPKGKMHKHTRLKVRVLANPAGQEECSFLINGRNYSYKRMSFGLNISGSEFQKSMDHVLGGPLLHDFVTIYVDDILIISETIEDHYNHIETVLKKFNEFNVTVIFNKI